MIELPVGWEVITPGTPVRGIPTASVPLELLPRGTDGPGITFRARYAEVVSPSPLEAETGVGIYSIGGSNDVVSMLGSIGVGDRDVQLVELPAGKALRRTYEHRGSVVRQFLVPVPSTPSDIVLLSYATPTLDRRDELLDLFDSMARDFGFENVTPGPVSAGDAVVIELPQLSSHTLGNLLIVVLVAIVLGGILLNVLNR